MSPSGDTQTPERKPSSGGLVSVFKSLTGSKSSKSPNLTSNTQSFSAGGFKNAIYGGPPDYQELYEQLKIGNPLSDRVIAAGALRHAVQDYPLSAVTGIFKEGKDLIDPSKPSEARTEGFQLLTACVQQSTSTDPERLAYFRILTAPANTEDFHLQLTSLVELARNGRDLSGFHYDLFPLLTSWLRSTFSTTTIARKQAGRQNRTSKTKGPLGEETNLASLFVFIIDVIKFNFNISTEDTTGKLIDAVLYICGYTPLSGDLKACIGVIDAITTYGDIPSDKLLEVVKVLSSIHCLVEEVQSEAWHSISNLCVSHNGQTTVRILLDILRNPRAEGAKDKENIREVRGAVSVLGKLFRENGENGYPLVPFTLLTSALMHSVVAHAKVEIEILRLIASFFDAENDKIKDNVLEEDWAIMFEVVSKCSQRVLDMPDSSQSLSSTHLGMIPTKEEIAEQTYATNLIQVLQSLILRIEHFLTTIPPNDLFQREECIRFFVHVHAHLPESCAKLVIDYYMESRWCYPSDLQWEENIKTILGAFFANRRQQSTIRLHALKAVTDVFEVVELMDQHDFPGGIQTFVAAILKNIEDEKDILILQEIVNFAVVVAENSEMPLFNYTIDTIRGRITGNRLQFPPGARQAFSAASRPATPGSTDTPMQTPSGVVAKGLVQIFMKTLDKSAPKSLRVFEELLLITRSHDCEIDARISAVKLLFRLRADWANRLFVTSFTESDGLAASLYRTEISLSRKQAIDDALHQNQPLRANNQTSRLSRSTSFGQRSYSARVQPVRSSSTVHRTVQRNHQMWMYPDADALPESDCDKASSLLASFANAELHDGSSIADLNIANYLEHIINLVEHGCDWEIYSYILVHLPSQLTNHALFKGAIPQIKVLRGLLCDQIKNNSFHDPPSLSGLRKADISICLFQILAMVMSYHEVFSKAEEDEIVRTFLQGIGTERTAKCCIHALAICCHELPGSVSKALVTILQKMSQIVTQSHIAMHILEFLACLARMPNLYVNFREEEYRIVFGVCFRYLQYVRDQAAKDNVNRNSLPAVRSGGNSLDTPRTILENISSESDVQPNTSDDLPQYVYSLAYHVITFWFLSLKLPDRAGLVSWMTKSLVSSDKNEVKIDEQAQVTLDFMQRVAYADVDESSPDPTFNAEQFGEILKKRWIVGNSIITIEQATRGDCAQITKRQPSGTSCYVIKEKFMRPPLHQNPVLNDGIRDIRPVDTNAVLPSHILLQLTASIPQGAEFSRPLALSDDEVTTRAVRSFDRNSTVDGHKVGVIYIGVNQTEEVEILANVMGTRDYTKFLSGLGTLTKLKGATFNTQGLDRGGDSDGEYAFCWRDRVTEIVFHVTTQMPTNLDNDPQCIGKKKHIGNDFVNIIFNNSGLPFKFDTFPSDFNFVNIVITPESRASFVASRLNSESSAQNTFFKVQVMSKPGFPEISPAAETKIVSLAALPSFIRLLALNASVFSLVWANREGGEHVSSWRHRLRAINQLRERNGSKSTPSNPASPPGTSSGGSTAESRNIRDSMSSLRRPSAANLLNSNSETSSQRSSMLSTADTEVVVGVASEESLVDSLDFSRWM